MLCTFAAARTGKAEQGAALHPPASGSAASQPSDPTRRAVRHPAGFKDACSFLCWMWRPCASRRTASSMTSCSAVPDLAGLVYHKDSYSWQGGPVASCVLSGRRGGGARWGVLRVHRGRGGGRAHCHCAAADGAVHVPLCHLRLPLHPCCLRRPVDARQGCSLTCDRPCVLWICRR